MPSNSLTLTLMPLASSKGFSRVGIGMVAPDQRVEIRGGGGGVRTDEGQGGERGAEETAREAVMVIVRFSLLCEKIEPIPKLSQFQKSGTAAGMSGLRERQKADRHDRIIEAATRLFREQGYEAVKMEAIAAAAEVSIGTIYNYYRNKGDLLVAIVSLEVDEVLKAGRGGDRQPARQMPRPRSMR